LNKCLIGFSLSNSYDSFTHCILKDIKVINEEIKSFTFELKKPIIYQICQNVNIKLKIENKMFNRTYTITSIPDKHSFEITIKKNGFVSNYFYDNMEIGNNIYVKLLLI
jgi:ferredoxin-NADP reductase